MTKGIRISDGDEVLSVTLTDILQEIQGKDLFWAILFLDGIWNKDADFPEGYQEKINHSKNGISTTQSELEKLSGAFFQMYETVVVASKNKEALRRYESDYEMFESCDITIDLVDCAFWVVFSKDKNLLESLKNEFTETEELDSANLCKGRNKK